MRSGSSQHNAQRRETSCATHSSVRSVLWSGFRFLIGRREKSFTANRIEAEAFARERFQLMLRHPFPGATDKEIARTWAARLNVSERTVENWLAGTHTASITDLTIVGATHGIWGSAAIFVGELTRDEVMNRIGR